MHYPLKGGTLERRCSCSTPNFSAANWEIWTFTTLTQKTLKPCKDNDVIYRHRQRRMFPFNIYCVLPELWVNTWIKPLQRYLGNTSVYWFVTPPSDTRNWQRNAVLLLRGRGSFSFGKMRLTLLAILGLAGDFSGESTEQEVKEADFVYATFNLLIPSPGARFSKVPIINGPGKLSPLTLKIEVSIVLHLAW